MINAVNGVGVNSNIMDFGYRELRTDHEIKQCLELQKSIFKFSETEIISPLILRLIARDNPPIGVTLGVFVQNGQKEELIGFICGFATFVQNTIYGTLIGISPSYQNKGLGLGLFKKFKDVCLKKGISYMNGVYDPIDPHLAYLYYNKLGFKGIKYIEEAFHLEKPDNKNTVPHDRLLIQWDLKEGAGPNQTGLSNENIFANYPVINSVMEHKSEYLIFPIPANFISLQSGYPQKALQLRLNSRKILKHYINNCDYKIVRCIRTEKNDGLHLYYLLKK